MVAIQQNLPDRDGVVVGSQDAAIGLVTKPYPGGSSWTLTSRLGHLLETAENSFGPRDRAFTPIGIEFGGDRPTTWFPGNADRVSIRLSMAAANSPSQAYYQLAHEVIHLLAPRAGKIACNFEEGLATTFSDDECAKLGIVFGLGILAYERPRNLVRSILKKQPDVIMLARAERPCMFDWTEDFLGKYVIGLSNDELKWLCSSFNG